MSSDRHRVELGGVQPRQGQPSGTEESDEEEKTESASLGGVAGAFLETPESDKHGNHLTDCTDKEELSSTDSLDQEEGGKSEGSLSYQPLTLFRGMGKGTHVYQRQDTTQNVCQPVRKPDLPLEQDSSVVDNSITTAELLEQLSRSANKSSSEMLVLAPLENLSFPGLAVGLSGYSV